MAHSNEDEYEAEETDGLKRSDCGRCGGSGETIEVVAGRSGLVNCPACDNVPEYALPNEIPDDSAGRLNEIEARLNELDELESRADTAHAEIETATDAIESAIATGVFGSGPTAVLEHLLAQVRRLGTRELEDVDREIRYEREQLREERRKLTTYLKARRAQAEGDDQDTDTEGTC